MAGFLTSSSSSPAYNLPCANVKTPVSSGPKMATGKMLKFVYNNNSTIIIIIIG